MRSATCARTVARRWPKAFWTAVRIFCPLHCFDFSLKTGECETVPFATRSDLRSQNRRGRYFRRMLKTGLTEEVYDKILFAVAAVWIWARPRRSSSTPDFLLARLEVSDPDARLLARSFASSVTAWGIGYALIAFDEESASRTSLIWLGVISKTIFFAVYAAAYFGGRFHSPAFISPALVSTWLSQSFSLNSSPCVRLIRRRGDGATGRRDWAGRRFWVSRSRTKPLLAPSPCPIVAPSLRH